MAVQMTLNNKNASQRKLQEKLRDEAQSLLSVDALGTRITQLDGIIKRKQSKVLFSMETSSGNQSDRKQKTTIGQDSERKYQVVEELLKKVRERRRMVRSYIYLSWFTVFFCMFLSILYIQEDNANRYAVDVSILNRITKNLMSVTMVSSNGLKYMPGDQNFYDWMTSTVKTIFTQKNCGDGACDAPEEYPGFGPFGCICDCGVFQQRTPIRVNFKPAWRMSPGGSNVENLVIGQGDKVDVQFKWNVWSETMGDYLLPKDTDKETLVFDAPDGRMVLELYQESIVSIDTSLTDMAIFGNFAPDSLMWRDMSKNDWVYGDKAEASAIVATVNRQIQQYCTVGAGAVEDGCRNYTISATAAALTQMYGLTGTVSVSNSKGDGRTTLLNVPFCTVDPADVSEASLPADRCGGTSPCLDATRMYRNFRCRSKFSFQVWMYGDTGRAVSVKDTTKSNTQRTLTPFNNLIGSVIVTQYKRTSVQCELSSNDAINQLITQYNCQGGRNTDPFGTDPMFLSFSSLYNGKLNPSDFYNDTEIPSQTGASAGVSYNGNPYAFFPHEWGRGGVKEDKYIHEKDVGKYKIYFDGRLTSKQASDRVAFFKDGHYLSAQTNRIEVEMITYNADFAIFGVVTFQFMWDLGGSIRWDYQYNTAELLPYRALKGSALLLTQCLFGILLIVDIVREVRDIVYAARHDNLWKDYFSRPMKYVNWSHYGLMFASLGLWGQYVVLTSNTQLKPSYPVLKDLTAKARLFETDPKAEYDMLKLVDQMRMIAETKNIYSSVNALIVLLFIARILKILDFQPRMALITRTLSEAGTDLLHFCILFTIVLVGYATMGCVLFGGQIIKFQTLVDSMIVLIFVLLGWDQVVFREMVTAANTQQVFATKLAFYLFYWSWIVISTFVLLNVILAIVVDAYSNVKRKSTNSRTMPSEMMEVARETGRALANQCVGSEWSISDHMLEKILVKQNQQYASRAKMRQAMGVMNLHSTKRPTIRMPGGISLQSKELMELLKGCGSRGKSLIQRARDKVGSKKDLGTLMGEQEESADLPPKAIDALLMRYGEIVDESMDDPEMLRLLKAENVRRQLAMYTSQSTVREQISALCDVVSAISEHTLPEDVRDRIMGERLIRSAQENCDDVGLDQVLGLTGCVSGMLSVTIVEAKDIPKLDTFTESDPYAVLIIEGSACLGDEHQEPFGRTRTIKNAPNPSWNEEFGVDTVVGKETKLVVAVLDDDKGDDDMVGKVMVSLNNHPLGQEIDRWYHLNPLPGGRAAAAMRSIFRMNHEQPMLRIKSKFTAHAPDVEEGKSSEVPFRRASSGASADRTASLPMMTKRRSPHTREQRTRSPRGVPSEIEWLRSKLGSLSGRKNSDGTVERAGLVVNIMRGHGWGIKGGGCKVIVDVDGKELGTQVVDVQEWGQELVFEEELCFEDYVTGGFKVKAMTSGIVGKNVWNCTGEGEVGESSLEMLSDTGKEWIVSFNDDSSIVLTCATRPREGSEAGSNTKPPGTMGESASDAADSGDPPANGRATSALADSLTSADKANGSRTDTEDVQMSMPKEHRVAGIAASGASSALVALHDGADGAHNANPATGANASSDYACDGDGDEAGQAPSSTATAEYSTWPPNSSDLGALDQEEYSSAMTSPMHAASSPPTRPSISQSRPSLSQSQRETFLQQ